MDERAHYQKYLVAFMLLLLTITYDTFAMAKSKTKSVIREFPRSCIPVGYSYQYRMLILEPKSEEHQQTLYMIHNISNKAVTLRQATDGDDFYVMHLKHTIKGNTWAALATDFKKSKHICTTEKKGLEYGEIIDCKSALKICEYTRSKFGSNHRGNYWLASGLPQKALVRKVIRHGILLQR